MIYMGVNTRVIWLTSCLIGALACTMCVSFAAAITIEETELHDGAFVYGLDVSDFTSPFINTDNYSVISRGDDSEAYANVSFSTYGFYSLNAVDIQNQGSIVLNANGGKATSTEETTAAIEAAGIATEGAVDNSKEVVVFAFGGTASVTAEADTEASAISTVSAVGIDSGDTVDNSAALRVLALGGTMESIINETPDGGALVTSEEGVFITGTSDASVHSLGIGAEGDVTNTATIMSVAMAKSAGGASTVLAGAKAVGIETGSAIDNNSTLLVGALGGEAITDGEFTDGTYAFAAAEAAGMLAEGAIVNDGQVQTIAEGGTASATNPLDDQMFDIADASAKAVAIRSETAVTNSGELRVNATGGNAVTDSLGGEGFEDPEARAHSNATGISSRGDVTNSGAIIVTSHGGDAIASEYAYASARAVGIEAEGMVNSGAISVIAEGGASSSDSSYAVAEAYAYGVHTYLSATNDGTITVLAEGGHGTSDSDAELNAIAVAYGLWSDGGGLNRAAITVTAEGGTTDGTGSSVVNARAYGIRTSDEMTNSGAISITAIGGTAEGANSSVYGEAIGILTTTDLTNSGAITVTATGGTANGPNSSAKANAAGIVTAGDLMNSGAIVVTANGGTATAEGSTADADAAGIYVNKGTAFITNSADITVNATAGEAYESSAAGIYFAESGSLTNTGIIRAFADSAVYEVYINAGTVTLLNNYNLTLDGDPTVGSLYVGEDAELNLNGALLSVTMINGTTQVNTPYQIFDTSDGGLVSGTFSGLASPINPDVVALYHDQGNDDSADDTVSLAYRPGASPQLEGVGLLGNTVNISANLVGQRLATGFLQSRLAAHAPRHYAAAQTVASDAGAQPGKVESGGFFFTPYYTNIEKDAAPAGYDADLVGFMTGIERESRGNLYGFHLGFGHAGIDYTGTGYSENREDQEVLSAGVHLMGGQNDWTWRAQVTGFYGWHDYEGLTGVSLEQQESADYDSYGVRTSLLGGHLFEHNGQILLPEVGVEYLWLHRDSFTTDADDSNWDLHSDSMDEHQVNFLASLRWLTRLQAGNVEVTPSLAAGIRYLVTDDELDVNQSVAGSGPVTVKSEQDDVTGTISASVRFRKEQLATELAYGGEFGDDTTMHSSWIRFRYLF